MRQTSKRSNRDSVQRLTLSGILLGIMLVLGFVEHMLPALTAVPGIKLGLSNSVLIFAVYMLDLPTAWGLMAMKVTLSGFLFSGPQAMMFAFAGGVLSLLGMSLLSRIRRVPAVAVSVLGGLLHNVGQVLMAIVASGTKELAFYLIPLAAAGVICGALTGTAATLVMHHLRGRLPVRKRTDADRRALAVIAALLLLAAGLIA